MLPVGLHRHCSRQESGRGEGLNVAANLSVWGSVMPALNIAARLGRHTEKKMIYVSQRREDDSRNGFLKLNKSTLQKTCQCATRRQNNYIYFTETGVHLWDLYESDFLCVFLNSAAIPSCLHRPPSLCLHTWNRTSCIFPPCFLCIQSCVLIRSAA